ncbi:MAG: hypothetical protein HS113_24395 [Verrucomicrobiales bacterium]|nr:hypothetical protein [Verrucomicrobiales bacterium]
MKPQTLLISGLAGLAILLGASQYLRAQPRTVSHRYEAAMIKWDGSDRVQVMTPAKSEVIYVYKTGGQRVTEIPDEEYCLTWVANKLLQEGWELVNLNNRRVLLHRPVGQ